MKLAQITTVIIILLDFHINGYASTCGRRLVQHTKLITNGYDANEGDWPWHAAVYHLINRDIKYKCGGTLIESNSILTAAHCVYENNRKIVPERIFVHLGKHNLIISGTNSQQIQANRIIPHPKYNQSDLTNDIAVILLATEATLNNYVQPVCLWNSNKVDISQVIGKLGTVAGWGVAETNELSYVLQSSAFPVVSLSTCLTSNRDFFGAFLSDTRFCAGFRNGTSVCNGDSGGSMTFNDNGVYRIRGIVSLSAAKKETGLCDTNEYAIFTDVAQYLTWIGEVVPELKISTRQSDTDLDDDDEIYVPFRYNDFDWKLIKAQMLTDPSNVILSPSIMKCMVYILMEGAGPDTSTFKEIQAALLSNQPITQVRELYGRIFESLSTKSNDYDLAFGTRVYVSEFIQPRARFTAIVESYYFSKVEQLNFEKATDSAKIINDWCAEVTQNHINKIVKSDDFEEAVLIMVNAAYFKASWQHPFPISRKVVLPFYTTPTAQLTLFMSVVDKFYYSESELLNAKILRMPYKGGKFVMTILLPIDKDGLQEMIRQLDSNTLELAQSQMKEKIVLVQLPRFKFDHTSELSNALKDIGIKSIFTNDASLPALARGADVHGRLQVSKILQKVGISVNEGSSTEHEATEVNRVGDATESFIANHPFLFIIEDTTTSTLLFAGKVINPNV